ncbi:hypothetical protein A8B75_04260 [Sphingomonadales bacterium EhC05]|nr:hypothetical protein A8B75_04260 [Sphingomonadales bacterium EhC05]
MAVALEAAKLFGTRAAETNLASVYKQAHQQAGHMCASDPIKLSLQALVRRRPSTYVVPLPPQKWPLNLMVFNGRDGAKADTEYLKAR